MIKVVLFFKSGYSELIRSY